MQSLLAIWKSGNTAVPLCQSHPPANLEYYVNDSESLAILVENEDLMAKVEGMKGTKTILSVKDMKSSAVAANDASNPVGVTHPEDAMLLYTSGTTGKRRQQSNRTYVG